MSILPYVCLSVCLFADPSVRLNLCWCRCSSNDPSFYFSDQQSLSLSLLLSPTLSYLSITISPLSLSPSLCFSFSFVALTSHRSQPQSPQILFLYFSLLVPDNRQRSSLNLLCPPKPGSSLYYPQTLNLDSTFGVILVRVVRTYILCRTCHLYSHLVPYVSPVLTRYTVRAVRTYTLDRASLAT